MKRKKQKNLSVFSSGRIVGKTITSSIIFSRCLDPTKKVIKDVTESVQLAAWVRISVGSESGS